MKPTRIISKTESLCPICLKKVSAQLYSQETNTYLGKDCPEHGFFKTVIWRSNLPIDKWWKKRDRAPIKNPATVEIKGCPLDCGLCSNHRQYTCTALIEVTQSCNLRCSFCFADSHNSKESNIALDTIELMYRSLMRASGSCNIQLSGGEPTLRDDLPEIIKMGVDLGFPFIQVNTNGIRIGEDEGFVKALKLAGLNSVFLQFDGTNEAVYQSLRGRGLLDIKIKAIENCKKHDIGVTLVPTLVPEINMDEIGNIIDFALSHTPCVRGVHFQPVSYFGRVPFMPKDKNRVTLPELMTAIEEQTMGRIRKESLVPPGCENPLCSFHGSYLYEGGNKITEITKASGCCGDKGAEEGSTKAKGYVARKWSIAKAAPVPEGSRNEEVKQWDDILERIARHSFSISAMAFQDVWNIDLERARDCCIHVVSPEGRLIPFCIYNLTDHRGQGLYRK